MSVLSFAMRFWPREFCWARTRRWPRIVWRWSSASQIIVPWSRCPIRPTTPRPCRNCWPTSGFEVLTAADLSQNEMREKVGDFAAKVAAKGPDTVALVFYAGHGLQIDGENFLVPVDVDPKREADIPLQAVRLNDILNTLTSVPSKMRILLLDACRNNPFPAINKTAGHGLAIVDAKTGAPGTFMSFSTSPGAEAEDGSGANSPYTVALLAAAKEPGLSIEDTFKRVRVSVNKATEGRQTPWDSSSLTDDFRFVGPGRRPPSLPRPPPDKAHRRRRWTARTAGQAGRGRQRTDRGRRYRRSL